MYHLGLAVLVVLAGCSHSSSPGPSAQNVNSRPESTRPELSPVAQSPSVQKSLVVLTDRLPLAELRLMRREITLSKQQPYDALLGARLIEVASDGTTTIEILMTTNQLQAGVGAFFTAPQYGRSGLKVLSASHERQEARLERTWCE